MADARRIRIVKREERAAEPRKPEPRRRRPEGAAEGEREARDVVSGWVRDHQRRSEEFRINYSNLLGELGFSAPWAGRSNPAATAVAAAK